MQENTVPVVDLNVCVSNVVPSTQPVSVWPTNINSVPLSPKMELLHQTLRSNPVTPVKVDKLESLLIGYPVSLKKFLVSGFSHGFRVSFTGERCVFESPNLKSALAQPDIVTSKINKERAAGRIVGHLFHSFVVPL